MRRNIPLQEWLRKINLIIWKSFYHVNLETAHLIEQDFVEPKIIAQQRKTFKIRPTYMVENKFSDLTIAQKCLCFC